MAHPWGQPLQDIVALEAAGDDAFTAVLSGFGAVTLGCAALAAGRTCDARSLHSLHSYFVRPVPPETRVRFTVERLRDGRRLALRRVQARIEDRLLFEMTASFAVPGAGAEFQDAVAPSLPPPDSLPTEEQIAREEGWKPEDPSPVGGPFEWRWHAIPWRVDGPGGPSHYAAWVRPRFPLPADRTLDAAAIAYVSDYHSHMSVARRLGDHFEPWGYTSLDQVIWVHQDLPWDDWRIMTTEVDAAAGGRALTRRSLYTRSGLLIASMAQEQLIPAPTATRA